MGLPVIAEDRNSTVMLLSRNSKVRLRTPISEVPVYQDVSIASWKIGLQIEKDISTGEVSTSLRMGRTVRIASGFAIFGIGTLMFIVVSCWPTGPSEIVTASSSLRAADIEEIAGVVRRDMLSPEERKSVSDTQSQSERLLARFRGEDAELNLPIDNRPDGTIQVDARFFQEGQGGFERKYVLSRRGIGWTVIHVEEVWSIVF
jgi:hypothetical protein